MTDTRSNARWSHFALAQAAIRGGAPLVQYRNKSSRRAAKEVEARALADLCDCAGAALVVNDDPSIAVMVGAGVHVGRDDASVAEARQVAGPEVWVGATIHNLDEIDLLDDAPVDYIGVGPVFGTQSKSDALPELGLDGLARICEASPYPVIAIGSITVSRVPDVLAAGAYGVAVLSAVSEHDDPEKETRRFVAALEACVSRKQSA